jgi:hypothetical protein
MFVALSHPTRAACDGSRAQTAQWCRASDGCARLHSQWQASLFVDVTLGGGTSSSRIWHDLTFSPFSPMSFSAVFTPKLRPGSRPCGRRSASSSAHSCRSFLKLRRCSTYRSSPLAHARATSALGTKPVTIHMFAPGAASESRGMLHIFRRPWLLLLSPSLSWSLHSPSSTGASPCFTHLRGHLHVSPPRHCFLSRVTPRSLPEFRCLCNVHLRSFYSRMAPVLRSASAFFLRVVWVCSSSASSC